VCVDDHSSDKTSDCILRFAKENSRIVYTENTRDIGQGYSVFSGIEKAKYNTIVIMDGDLQVNPKDIKKLYQYMNKYKLDFICSKRKTRQDRIITKHIPSIMGNTLIRVLFGIDFTDIGSSLKIVRKENVIKITPFKNVHRYIAILLHFQNLQYSELEIEHRERKEGESKYGFIKFMRVLFEILILLRETKKIKNKKKEEAN